MFTLKRSLLTLLTVPLMVGATFTGSASAARAHQPVSLSAVLQGRTLTVKGSHFDPSARISLALIDTRGWTTLFRGTATAEAATYPCPPGASVMCGQKDPNAGDLAFETTLHRRPNPAVLALLYRSQNEVGFGRVRAQ